MIRRVLLRGFLVLVGLEDSVDLTDLVEEVLSDFGWADDDGVVLSGVSDGADDGVSESESLSKSNAWTGERKSSTD